MNNLVKFSLAFGLVLFVALSASMPADAATTKQFIQRVTLDARSSATAAPGNVNGFSLEPGTYVIEHEGGSWSPWSSDQDKGASQYTTTGTWVPRANIQYVSETGLQKAIDIAPGYFQDQYSASQAGNGKSKTITISGSGTNLWLWLKDSPITDNRNGSQKVTLSIYKINQTVDPTPQPQPNPAPNPTTSNLVCKDETVRVDEGERVSFKVDVRGSVTNDIEYGIDDEPRGSDFNKNTGRFSWTTEVGDEDTYRFEYSATDGYSECEGDIKITVESERVRNTTPTVQIPSYPTIPQINIPTPITPTIVQVPVTRTVVVERTAQVVEVDSNIDLSQFNIRVEKDENDNVYVIWETSKPSRGYVVYGLASQPNVQNYRYEYSSPQSTAISTSHKVWLGNLQSDRTYYFRIVSEVGTQVKVSEERSFIMLNSANSINSVALGSAIATLGLLIFNPFFLMLVIIALLLLIIFKRKEGHVAVYQQPAQVEIGG